MKTFESYISLVAGMNKVYSEIQCSHDKCCECPFHYKDVNGVFECIRRLYFDAIQKAYKDEIEAEEKKWKVLRNEQN